MKMRGEEKAKRLSQDCRVTFNPKNCACPNFEVCDLLMALW